MSIHNWLPVFQPKLVDMVAVEKSSWHSKSPKRRTKSTRVRHLPVCRSYDPLRHLRNLVKTILTETTVYTTAALGHGFPTHLQEHDFWERCLVKKRLCLVFAVLMAVSGAVLGQEKSQPQAAPPAN